MLPATYKLVAVPSFGATCNFKVESTPYRIDPTSGELEYGALNNDIDETGNNGNTPAETLNIANGNDKMYGLNGVMSCDGTSLTGTLDLYLVNVEATLESDDALSEPLASLSFSGESGAKLVSFGN